MTKKPKAVEFEEGWADELDLTPDELADLVRGITQLVETGEIFEEAIPVDELPDDERAEIYERLSRPKNTRHWMIADDLVYRLRKRAEIRKSITTRKSVQNNEPDRIADLLLESALAIEELQGRYELLKVKGMLDET